MLTRDEIDRRKERLRKDPHTARLCAKLGVTVERFLQDIEHSPQAKLHDHVPPGREEERKQAIVAIARRIGSQVLARRDEAAHRFDAVAAENALHTENHARRLLGAQD